MRKSLRMFILIALFTGLGCATVKDKSSAGGGKGSSVITPTFGEDLNFLKKYTNVIVLSADNGRAQVAVAPALQGRVMSSTVGGSQGLGFGWINRELIASGKNVEHINAYGGEDRFWMGPEGGQYSIFFAQGVPFNLEDWYTPAPLDTESFEVRSKTDHSVKFQKKFRVTNYFGTDFDVLVNREVSVLSTAEAWSRLGLEPSKNVEVVAYQSVNDVTNAGSEAWRKKTGLLSIWILGMYNPSADTTVVIPIKGGSESKLGRLVNSDYFGKVPAERLVIKDGLVFFKGDGQYRSKIGISPQRVKPVLGSYDARNKVLTLVQFSLPKMKQDYVNSMWKIQQDPYEGDVANSYNDGPADQGAKPLGPFYELESSSPAMALMPGQMYEHIHRTIHLQGDEAELDRIAKAVLGVGLKEIAQALPQSH